MVWTKRWRKRLRVLLRRDEVERELDEELSFHLEMETEKNLRAGMSPEEARRQATLAFGGVAKHREEVRDARALGWVSGASLDLKLGLRMLRKYPGLTVAGGLAMAFAIAAGAVTFEVVGQVLHPRLPLDGGERVVGILTRDAEAGRAEFRVASDFLRWREELETIDDLGAFRPVERNLIVPGGPAEPVRLAEITASGFRVARVPPLLGRWLVEEDEREGAPPVAVLGHDLWRRRFAADPGVVGRQVRLGDVVHTVVGVMPEGFAFPYKERMWVPLRLGAWRQTPAEGPAIRVFGRRAPGASLDDARAEVAALGRRAAADSPETHEHLRPEVLPYVRSIIDVPWDIVTGAAYSTQAGVLLFLLLVCANVATLVFARTASRESELVVRTALGASRRRIVLQLFAEALVLGGLAAALGLGAAAFGLRWGREVFESVETTLPFWFHASLSPRTLAYAALLGVLAAAVAGVVPALKMTGKRGESRLRQAGAGGSSLRFGGLWTGIIVTQVALTAASVPIVVDAALDTDEIRTAEAGFPAEEYLSARLETDLEVDSDVPEAASKARQRATLGELERRLEAEPAVAGVTFASQVPGGYHPLRPVGLDGEALPPPSGQGRRMQVARVAPDFFEVIGTPVLSGRGFRPGEAGEDARVVVVNESFVRAVLGDRNPVGRRLRFLDPDSDADDAGGEDGPWYEIVGVVRDVMMWVDPDLDHNGGIYLPADPGDEGSLSAVVRVRGDPWELAPRLRAIAAEVDPTLRLYDLGLVGDAKLDLLTTYWFWVRVAFAGCAIVLLLSVLGIHAIMAFTVARRTREIGIRVALGADRRRVVMDVFARAFRQVALGISVGTLLLALTGGIHSARTLTLLATSVAIMLAAAVVACVVPTRRALAVPPTEAMRADA